METLKKERWHLREDSNKKVCSPLRKSGACIQLKYENYQIWRTFSETEETNYIQLNLGIQCAERRAESRKLLLLLERTFTKLYFVTNVTGTVLFCFPYYELSRGGNKLRNNYTRYMNRRDDDSSELEIQDLQKEHN